MPETKIPSRYSLVEAQWKRQTESHGVESAIQDKLFVIYCGW